MRKMKLFYGILVGLLIFTCSSNDDSPNPPESTSIIGNWNLIARIVDGNPNGITCPFTLNITQTEITDNENFGTNCENSDSSTATYTLSGNTFTSDGFVHQITNLELNEFTWQANDPDTNDLIVSTFERIE